MNSNVLGFDLEQLNAMVAYWQDRLGLCDWEIRLCIGGRSEDMQDCWGRISSDYDKHQATITIATDHEDYVELVDTIIHELCHLVFWWVAEGTESKLLERAFNRVCRAMAEDHAELIAKGVRKKKCSIGGIFSKTKTARSTIGRSRTGRAA